MASDETTQDSPRDMSAWEEVEEFKSEVERLRVDLDRFVLRQNERFKRIAALPDLGFYGAPKGSGMKDDDPNVRTTQMNTNHDHLPKHIEASIDTMINEDPSKDPFRMSTRLLEKKIESNVEVFAMLKQGQPWKRATVKSVFCHPGSKIFTFRLVAPPELNNRIIDVKKYAIARIQNHSKYLEAGKRVIAGQSRSNMLPGIIGQLPEDYNQYRYMVLMDDGSASYFEPSEIYPILWQSEHPWLDGRLLQGDHSEVEAHLRYFFANYPKRMLLKTAVGDRLSVYRNGDNSDAIVISIDCDTMWLVYRDKTRECLFRGSPRIMQKRQDIVNDQLARIKSHDRFFHELEVNFLKYHEAGRKALNEDYLFMIENFDSKVVISKPKNVAKKSTASILNPIATHLETRPVDESLQVEEWDQERAERFKLHKCSPQCLQIPGVKTELSVKDMKEEFRDVSDLKVPLLLSWKRKIIRSKWNNKFRLSIVYEAPCGKPFKLLKNIKNYIFKTGSRLDIDFFTLEVDIKLNRELSGLRPYYFVKDLAFDEETGKHLENKCISVLNPINEERIPSDFKYKNISFPHPRLAIKGFSFNTDFKSSCDCEDDCQQWTSCACHKLNFEFAGKIITNQAKTNGKYQYVQKRLMNGVVSGIFECNSGCKCSSRCSNRLVQNGIRFRLQVQYFEKKGWGVVTLDDIPQGAFICTYAAELLDDADQYGDSDMYYADLDFISKAEETKRCSETEVSDEGVDLNESGDDETASKRKAKRKRAEVITVDSDDDDDYEEDDEDEIEKMSQETSVGSSTEKDAFVPSVKENKSEGPKEAPRSRYPKREVQLRRQLAARPARRARPVRLHEVLESHDFTLDARVRGNVGRFFNHSCDPNSFVQNVFIETQDLRFPEVAFFSLKNIKASEEITWNYNYKVDAIKGRRIDCHCQAVNCRKRIL